MLSISLAEPTAKAKLMFVAAASVCIACSSPVFWCWLVEQLRAARDERRSGRRHNSANVLIIAEDRVSC